MLDGVIIVYFENSPIQFINIAERAISSFSKVDLFHMKEKIVAPGGLLGGTRVKVIEHSQNRSALSFFCVQQITIYVLI